MSVLKYKIGDRVRIKSIDWYNKNKDEFGNVGYFTAKMTQFCGKITIVSEKTSHFYRMENIDILLWTDEMIEGLVEEETKPKYEDEVNGEYYSTPKYLVRPSGYVFKDENGNEIHALKIVLEKANTLKTQSDNMEYKELLLGLVPVANKGQELIPHKDYEIKQDGEKFYLVKKKKEYPKTYWECCRVLGISDGEFMFTGLSDDEYNLFDSFVMLKRCRDAYWKIAGDEMELGKPWEPSNDEECYDYVYYICYDGTGFGYSNIIHRILVFPTEEMRDAFYENFKELIEQCKELL